MANQIQANKQNRLQKQMVQRAEKLIGRGPTSVHFKPHATDWRRPGLATELALIALRTMMSFEVRRIAWP